MNPRDATSDGPVVFGPFSLDLAGGQLSRDGAVIPLRRKALEVLRHLARRRGEVVPNDELLNVVWPDVHVTPQTVTNIIHELRLALDDPARAPRFLHTVHRQGHMLVATPAADAGQGGPRTSGAPSDVVVGRDAELSRLHAAWREVLSGHSRVVFVTGEPGIGKTTLVDAAVRALANARTVRAARGSCVEQHGQDEAYIPLLDAVDDLLSGPDGPAVLAVLRRSAPTWLVQMPWRLGNADHERLERALLGTTAARMLREGLALLRTLATTKPLLLVLEDLHWSDLATLDLVTALARRPLAVPLLVLATYRQVDAAVRAHPLVKVARDLRRTGAVLDVALPPFDVTAIHAYLAARFGLEAVPATLLARLVEHSAGNPLFVRAIVDQLAERGAIVAGEAGWTICGDPATLLVDFPESLRDFVAAEVAAMDGATREVVEAASVVGVDFTARDVASALARPAADVEDACESLSRVGRILRVEGDGSAGDGAATRRYGFVHAAHHRIVYEHTGPVHRRALHLAAADALLAAAPTNPDPIAARLALHYERGGDVPRAIEYLERAASHAERRFAYRESSAYLRAAVRHLDALAATDPSVAARTPSLLLNLGGLLAIAAGYAARETEEAFERVRRMCDEHEQPHALFLAEMALCRLYLARAEIMRGWGHGERLLTLARSRVPELTVLACCWAGFAASSRGDLPRARALLEEGAASPPAPSILQRHDMHRMIDSQLALVLAVMGDPRSSEIGDAALRRGVAANFAPDLVHALVQAAERAAFVRDPGGHRDATQAIAIAEENEIPTFLMLARFYEAHLDEQRPGPARLAAMQEALAARHALGDRFQDSVLLALITERQIELGDHDGAAATLADADAHVAASGELHHEPELARLRGALVLARGRTSSGAVDEAAACFRSAIELAASRSARLWQLRAACALAALPLPRSERAAARNILAETLAGFPASSVGNDVGVARHMLASES